MVDLAHESECLKATIARQQEQIDALLKQKELKSEKIEKSMQQVQQEAPRQELARNDNWACRDCTFQNIQQLQECEMCGAARSLERPVKRSRQTPPAVIEVPQDAFAVRDLSAGPREFLRQATQVVEANACASQSALQENHEVREADICEATCMPVY